MSCMVFFFFFFNTKIKYLLNKSLEYYLPPSKYWKLFFVFINLHFVEWSFLKKKSKTIENMKMWIVYQMAHRLFF